jgi:type II secretory pathway pseudopilin PulG
VSGKRTPVLSLRRALIVAMILLVTAALLFPVLCRNLGLPHNSRRLEIAVDDAAVFGRALADYRKEHGELPESRWRLGQYLKANSRYGPDRALCAARLNQWQYSQDSRGKQPVVARLLLFGNKRVLVTVDGTGTVRVSVVRTWPTWKLSKGGLRIGR